MSADNSAGIPSFYAATLTRANEEMLVVGVQVEQAHPIELAAHSNRPLISALASCNNLLILVSPN